MAANADLLFDLNDVDLDGVALSPERIGDMNPQSGDMRQLDHMIWVRDDLQQALGIKQVHDDEFWVAGHIPGRPLLPGVLMIEAAAQVSSIMYRLRAPDAGFLGFTRCDAVAFRGQVVPGDTLYLLSEEVDFRRRRLITNAQGVVDGRIVFEAQITGMVL